VEIKPKLPIWKRVLRGLIKTIFAVAGIVFIFDNRVPLGRKNYLFAGSDAGGDRAEAI
jgi:hypothetical protein